MQRLIDYVLVTEPVLTGEDLSKVFSYCRDGAWSAAETRAVEMQELRTCSVIHLTKTAHAGDYGSVAVDAILAGAIGRAGAAYKQVFPNFLSESDSGYDLLRYEVGQFYGQHIDYFSEAPRCLAVSLALNDDYDGGQFKLFGQECIPHIRAGCALLFPANFQYPHEVLPVTSGTRYSCITWFQ